MNTTINNVDQLVFSMLTENTGSHFLDSGGAYGRNWEQNQKKSIEDFKSQPAITIDKEWLKKYKEYDVTYSVFHYLTAYISLNELCDDFNSLPADKFNLDWDGFAYGVSAKQTEWLNKNGFVTIEADDPAFDKYNDHVYNTFNTYNDPDNFGVLSQILQGTFIYNREDQEWYCLLQVHGGCDARGGYTDAKLVQITDPGTWDGPLEWLPTPDYTLSVNGKLYDIRGVDTINVDGGLDELPKITSKTKIEGWATYE